MKTQAVLVVAAIAGAAWVGRYTASATTAIAVIAPSPPPSPPIVVSRAARESLPAELREVLAPELAIAADAAAKPTPAQARARARARALIDGAIARRMWTTRDWKELAALTRVMTGAQREDVMAALARPINRGEISAMAPPE